MPLERLKTDILILGSGGAGLFAALHAHKANPDLGVTIATKGLLGKCGCTRMVQGGYNVALNPGDSIAIPTARCTAKPSPARASTARCTRAISPASKSSTG